ncbi:hypothetical protein B0H13DRAFT_2357409 [Mycena leptocephala]|nr:hypothetical protein B0H13DRAFT_2357409 [Mycena leptocephala]
MPDRLRSSPASRLALVYLGPILAASPNTLTSSSSSGFAALGHDVPGLEVLEGPGQREQAGRLGPSRVALLFALLCRLDGRCDCFLAILRPQWVVRIDNIHVQVVNNEVVVVLAPFGVILRPRNLAQPVNTGLRVLRFPQMAEFRDYRRLAGASSAPPPWPPSGELPLHRGGPSRRCLGDTDGTTCGADIELIVACGGSRRCFVEVIRCPHSGNLSSSCAIVSASPVNASSSALGDDEKPYTTLARHQERSPKQIPVSAEILPQLYLISRHCGIYQTASGLTFTVHILAIDNTPLPCLQLEFDELCDLDGLDRFVHAPNTNTNT